jgi:nitrogen fixation protein FixH
MKAETAWKWMPAVLLTVTAAFAIWRVLVAVDDPHFGVVENAYEKSGRWDEEQAELRAAKALGWKLHLTPAVVRIEEAHVSTLAISGPGGVAVEGVTGTVSGFHNGYPGQRFEAPLEVAADGGYCFTMPLENAGLWRWQLRLTRGDDLWVGEIEDIVSAGGPR